MATLLLWSFTLFSKEIDQRFVISSVEVSQVPTHLAPLAENPIDEIAMYLDGLLAIGKKIWPIIVAGQPVITTTGLIPALSVIPYFESTNTRAELKEMAGWSPPKAFSYRVSYKNRYKNEVIGFTYTVFFQYNGSYKGNGKYITSLKIQASEVYASWGFNFDAASELISVANVGTTENPVASAIVQVFYKGKGPFNEIRNAHSFFLDGNGSFHSLN